MKEVLEKNAVGACRDLVAMNFHILPQDPGYYRDTLEEPQGLLDASLQELHLGKVLGGGKASGALKYALQLFSALFLMVNCANLINDSLFKLITNKTQSLQLRQD